VLHPIGSGGLRCVASVPVAGFRRARAPLTRINVFVSGAFLRLRMSLKHCRIKIFI
jgi:hypothetical protein